jgi:hypothetical protein
MIALGVAVLTVALDAKDLVQLRSGVSFEVDRHEAEAEGFWVYTQYGARYLSKAEVAGISEILPPGADKTPEKPPARPTTTREMIDDAAKRHGLPAAIVHAVANAESGYDQKAVSRAGAIGIMQLMPATASALGANPSDEAQNIDAGTRFLRSLLVKYRSSPDQVRLALAAYNAGPGAVARYQGVPPYAETRTYIRRVVGKYEKLAASGPAEQASVPSPAAPPPVPLPVATKIVDKPTIAGAN